MEATAAELLEQEHSRAADIHAARAAMCQLWSELQKLARTKQRELERAVLLAQFEENCEDMRNWLEEKSAVVQQQPAGSDLRALQAVQRRFQNLERVWVGRGSD